MATVVPVLDNATLDRMVRAVAEVKERCLRVAREFEARGIPYAVIGGNAVAYWVATKDDGAVRNTPEVNLMISRSDATTATAVMEAMGFVRVPGGPGAVFLTGPAGNPRSLTRLMYAGERVAPADVLPFPGLDESIPGPEYRVCSLDAVVRMKLLTYRLKDQVHIRDLIGVGLIDDTWPAKYPPPLDERLRVILADPDG